MRVVGAKAPRVQQQHILLPRQPARSTRCRCPPASSRAAPRQHATPPFFQVHPAQGQRGTVITIKGIGLFAGGAKVVRVKLSSADAAKVLTQSATEVTAEVSSVFVDKDTVNDVTVILDNGQTVKGADLFTYKVAGSIEAVYVNRPPAMGTRAAHAAARLR